MGNPAGVACILRPTNFTDCCIVGGQRYTGPIPFPEQVVHDRFPPRRTRNSVTRERGNRLTVSPMTKETCTELFKLGQALCAAMEHRQKCLGDPQTTLLTLTTARNSLDRAKTALSDHRNSCVRCRARWVEYLAGDPCRGKSDQRRLTRTFSGNRNFRSATVPQSPEPLR